MTINTQNHRSPTGIQGAAQARLAMQAGRQRSSARISLKLLRRR